ncbi:Rhomboid protein 2 [Podosphaera aphanis]|nr:Rhomboid protein 2 [Podosphaera aphanis]
MALSLPRFSAIKLRGYLFRLPLFTRLVTLAILLLWIAGLQPVWDIQKWGALIPEEVGLTSMYRTNTFPLIHHGFLHALSNVFALTPLLERFEAENGTLTTLALFLGPLSTIPALLYTFLERVVFRMNTSIFGASIWVFTLLASEAIKTHQRNPSFVLGTVPIPTWTTPPIMALFVSVLIPHTSLLGHVCGLAFGYGWSLGYLKFLAPPEWALRWIEAKLNLSGWLPHYVSIDQKTIDQYKLLPIASKDVLLRENSAAGYLGSSQRLGP